MSNDQIVKKIKQGDDISVSQLGKVLLEILQKQDDNLNDFAGLTMAEFDKVHAEFGRVHGRIDGVERVMATKSDLEELEERLALKIEASHGTTNRRINWLEAHASKTKLA